MIRSLWISKTGIDAQQTNLDVVTNNLANVGTNGFKRSRAVFEDLLYQNLRQPGAQSSQLTMVPTGFQLGTGVHPIGTERIHTQGNLEKVDNPMSVAINGNGFFQVLKPDGTTAYTRDGTFQLDNQGQLVTISGYAIQPSITIPASALSVTIGSDGTVSVMQAGSATPTQVGSLQLANFVNPGGLQAVGENLFAETAASGAPATGAPGANGLGVINQGFVETSNVNVVEEMVKMIEIQRAYEVNSKAITVSDQMLQRLTQI